jgi:phage gp46-like protein
MTYDGDPKLYETGAGADLSITEGQPVMDAGLENAVYLSIFGGSSWWGNAISRGAEKFTSQFESVNRRTLTNATRLDAEQYAKDALAWLVTEGVAKRVTVAASMPGVGLLGLAITIEQPDRAITVRYSINWATFSVQAGVAA